jgi:hypothetical protein
MLPKVSVEKIIIDIEVESIQLGNSNSGIAPGLGTAPGVLLVG